jgi:PQQ enzyme repeat
VHRRRRREHRGPGCVVGQTAYLAEGNTGDLTALDLATGKPKWRQSTGFDTIDQVLPLDATHVAVTGLVDEYNGAVEDIDSLSVATGAEDQLWQGSGQDGTDTSTGSVDLVELGGQEYCVLVDPSGPVHTITTTGTQVAAATEACSGRESVLGDTLACPGDDALILLAVPGLRGRGTIPTPKRTGVNADVAVVHGSYLLTTDNTVQGLSAG